MKHLVFIDSDTCVEYKSEIVAMGCFNYHRLKHGSRVLLVSMRSNYYEILDSMGMILSQVYSFDEVLAYIKREGV
jgi:hypothetical protein